MPFRSYKQFDSQTLDLMTAAYDAVVKRLNIQSSDPLTSKLAAKLIALVNAGERDLGRLTEQALAGLK
jgi:hypothetical protein